MFFRCHNDNFHVDLKNLVGAAAGIQESVETKAPYYNAKFGGNMADVNAPVVNERIFGVLDYPKTLLGWWGYQTMQSVS